MARTPEGKVKDQIKAWLKTHKVWFFLPANNGMGQSGIPDFICCAKGRFVGIEAKAPGKRGCTTALQDMQLQLIHEAGGLSIIVDDVTQLEGLLK